MAKDFKTYATVCCIASGFGCLLYISQYWIATKVEGTEIVRVPYQKDNNVSHKVMLEQFNVDTYHVISDNLELIGHYNDSSDLHEKRIRINGLADLINQVKPFLLLDKKFRSADFTGSKLFSESRKVLDVDCNAVMRGDQREINRTTVLMKANPKTEISAKEYIGLASDCAAFIKEREYITSSLTEVEKTFHIAFSLLMFKSVEQAERLLRAIYRPQNLYCIHVDKKSEADILEAMSAIADCFENVFIVNNSVSVEWGTFSVLEPELLCMEELWNKSTTWKYFINLTGQEFPLRTNYELVRILQAYNGANDVEATIERASKDRWVKAGPTPHGIIPTKGSVHVVVNRGFVDFVLHDTRAKDFLNWTRYVDVPDETFFSSLNHNPSLGVPGAYKGLPETEFKENIKPFVARFKNWGDSIYDWPCHGQRVRMVCVFGIGDLPQIASRRELFANKFYIDYHHYALDCLEELHYNHTRDEYLGKQSFDPRWYSKLGFVTNKID